LPSKPPSPVYLLHTVLLRLPPLLALPRPTMLPLLPLLALLVCPALGQIGFWGNCPAPTTVTLANPAVKLTGATGSAITWYEQRRYYSWLEGANTCVNWKFTADGTSTTKWNAVTNMRKHGVTSVDMSSSIEFKNSATRVANFWYTVTKLPGTQIPLPGQYNYQIIAVHDDYLVAWSCRQHWFHNEQMLWIMSSAQRAETSVITAAIDAATTAGLTVDNRRLETVLHHC